VLLAWGPGIQELVILGIVAFVVLVLFGNRLPNVMRNLGRGIVEPVDDFRDSNPPTNADLLEALAADFQQNGFDQKQILKTILMSRTYQRSSRTNDLNRSDEKLFSHSRVRMLSAEQLLDAICHVEVVPEYGAVEYQVTLTNTSSERCKPISDLWALSLTLCGFEGLPKIVSSSGGAYGKLQGYPGREVYWVRTDMPMSRFGPEFSHGSVDGVSSDQDLPIFLATAGAQSDAPGLFLGMEWS